MESLIRLLQTLIEKVPFLSEDEKNTALGWLRDYSSEVGVKDVVPPEPGTTTETTAPADAIAQAPDPGLVAEPVPADEQAPPPTSPEVADASPEASNAFAEPPPAT